MYVCMYSGHSVLHSNSKLHDNFGKMQTIVTTEHCTPCNAHARPIRIPRIILVQSREQLVGKPCNLINELSCTDVASYM